MKVIVLGGRPPFYPGNSNLLTLLVIWARLAVTLCPRGKPKHLEGVCLLMLQNVMQHVYA